MAGPFVEIQSDDMAASRDFFAGVMGWDWTGELGQGWFETGDGQIGLHEGAPSLMVFLPTDDLDATLARIREAGGTVDGEIVAEPGFGRFANCIDPRGIRFGLHERADGPE
ncbi:MAG: VOC family protein [Jannaschia sp.]